MSVLMIFLLLLNFANQNAKPSILEGKWRVYETFEHKKRILTLERCKESIEPNFMDHFGHFMEFNANGTYAEYASAQCGLDDNRFSYTGNWKFQNLILNFENIQAQSNRPNIYNKYTLRSSGKLKFISQKENELKFEITNHWEKVK